MKFLFNHFKVLGSRWLFFALATSTALLGVIQVTFLGIQSQIAQKAEIAGRSVINGSNSSLNPYYFSQAISGLEMGGMLSCVEIKKAGQPIPFYESTPEHCEQKPSLNILLQGEERVAGVKSANGEEWQLKFRAVNGPLFSLALWAIRIASILFSFAIFAWAEWRIKTIEHIQEARAQAATELAHFATQVAHDIRSPLAALNALAKSPFSSREESEGVLIKAIQRINDIANSLLEKEKDTLKVPTQSQTTVPVRSLLDSLIAEKKIEFKHLQNLEFITDLNVTEDAFTRGDSTTFARAISNLINNSVEAIGSKPGKIKLIAYSTFDSIQISISDNGPGISETVLKNVGKRGFSFGKGRNGSGLGVFQAKEAVQSMEGSLSLTSDPGGASVIIYLPRAIAAGCEVVLVDDDESLHLAWKFAAKARGRPIRCFRTFSELRDSLHLVPKTAEFYIDSHLAGESKRGERLAKDLYQNGYTNLFLCTGISARNFPKMPWIKEVLGKEPPWL